MTPSARPVAGHGTVEDERGWLLMSYWPTSNLHSAPPPAFFMISFGPTAEQSSDYSLIKSTDQWGMLLNHLMRFVGALDAILALAVAWKLPGHFEKPTWHKPTNCRVDDNDIPNLEFV
jgi:hypothetical protein